jgi:hypothetical protein
VAQRLGMRRGIVIFQFLESHLLDDPPAASPEGARSKSQAWVLRTLGTQWADRIRIPLNQWHDSPFQALAVKLEKDLRNNVLLPNSFAAFVIQEKLRNADTILFLRAEFQAPAYSGLAADRWAAYFAWYAGQLRKDGFDFIILPVPNRSTIYAPLLERPRDVSASRAALEEFASRLKSRGVSVVSLLGPYDREATARLSSHQYIYFLDDTHWNGAGTAIAARALLERIRTR